MDVFQQLNRQHGITIAIITHDASVAARAVRVITLRDGKIVGDTRQGEESPLGAAHVEAERPPAAGDADRNAE
jgi:macrolide transport system ATP-binding/permease protein